MLIFPFKLLNVILRHSSFPNTSTFSAFVVSYKNVLYKFTVIIIIINVANSSFASLYSYLNSEN